MRDVLMAALLRVVRADTGVAAMQKLVAVAAAMGGIAAIATGLQCGVEHFLAGDLGGHYQECLATVISGVAVFSPGVQALKIGPFSRPGA